MNVSKYWPIVDVVLHARFQPWVSNSLSAYTGATDTYADLITLFFPLTIVGRKYIYVFTAIPSSSASKAVIDA